MFLLLLQNDLDHMQLPEMIRWRLQAAMPMLPPSSSCSISCQPPAVSTTAIALFQSCITVPSFQQGNLNPLQRNSVPLARAATNITGKSKQLPLQDQDMEIDPWTLLEDGTNSGPSSSNSNVGVDHANLKACSWLKGTMRVRRTDLTYIGTVDDDSWFSICHYCLARMQLSQQVMCYILCISGIAIATLCRAVPSMAKSGIEKEILMVLGHLWKRKKCHLQRTGRKLTLWLPSPCCVLATCGSFAGVVWRLLYILRYCFIFAQLRWWEKYHQNGL